MHARIEIYTGFDAERRDLPTGLTCPDPKPDPLERLLDTLIPLVKEILQPAAQQKPDPSPIDIDPHPGRQ